MLTVRGPLVIVLSVQHVGSGLEFSSLGLNCGHFNGPKTSLLKNVTKTPLLQLNSSNLVIPNLKSI